MASTYSTSLRIELQGTGENSGTWGTITNNNFSQSLEFSIAGVVDVACGDNAVTTLTNADGPQSQANNQARNAHIRLTGAHGAVRIAQFPATQKIYLITNATTITNIDTGQEYESEEAMQADIDDPNTSTTAEKIRRDVKVFAPSLKDMLGQTPKP